MKSVKRRKGLTIIIIDAYIYNFHVVNVHTYLQQKITKGKVRMIDI